MADGQSTRMNINASNPSVLPFHIAKAYGVNPIAQISRQTPGVSQSSTSAQVSAPAAPAGVEQSKKLSAAGQSLVGAVVPGRVDFSGNEPKQVGGALQMYRHPADKNAAATAVNVGRKLDVSG